MRTKDIKEGNIIGTHRVTGMILEVDESTDTVVIGSTGSNVYRMKIGSLKNPSYKVFKGAKIQGRDFLTRKDIRVDNFIRSVDELFIYQIKEIKEKGEDCWIVVKDIGNGKLIEVDILEIYQVCVPYYRNRNW